MKIEEIEVINLRYEIPPEQRTSYAGGQLTGRLTSLVRVTTSDGTVGWGSAYSHPELVRIVIEDHLKPLLPGDDPREVEPHRIEDGCFRLPKAPGLGVDLDDAVIRRWTMPAGQRLPIGAYSDMSFGKEYWVFREPY